MPAIKELFHRLPALKTETRRPEVHFKPIPSEYSGMLVPDVEEIVPAEDIHSRMIKINNMLNTYEGLSERQFAHFAEDMIHIQGGVASMYKGQGTSKSSGENKHLIQIAQIGKDINLMSESGVFAGPDVQARKHRDLDKRYSEGVTFTLTENISIFSHDPSREPQVKRWINPFFQKDKLLPQEEEKILNDLGLKKEVSLNPKELHNLTTEIMKIYQSTVSSSTDDSH